MGLLRNRPQADAPPPTDPGGSDAELVAQAKQGNARVFARHATEPLDEAPDVEDPTASPEDAAVRADQERELRHARERCLTPSERELFDLRLQGLSDQEIAAALGRGYGAIRTAQYRLVQKLRDCLGVVHRAKGARHVEV